MGKALERFAARIRLRSYSSPDSQRKYVDRVERFLRQVGRGDDELIGELEATRTLEERERVYRDHVLLVEGWGASLKDKGRAPNTIQSYFTAVKAFYRANGFDLPLKYLAKVHVEIRDRAPTPEEIQRMLQCTGSVRDRFILLALALTGVRQGTLVQLKYRHVRKDLEGGRVPVHIHVEREIVKGAYRDFDTFLGEEGVELLKIYRDERRRGALRYDGAGMPPEEINDESPLLRNANSGKVKGISTNVTWKVAHNAMKKAGLLNVVKSDGERNWYSLNPHSIRKFFRTQLAVKGVPRDSIEYMMGHKLPGQDESYFCPTVEQLQEWYVKADLRVKPSMAVAEELRDQMLIERIEKEYEVPRSMIEEFVMKLRVEEKTQALREPEVLREWFKREMIRRETVLSKREWVERETVDRE